MRLLSKILGLLLCLSAPVFAQGYIPPPTTTQFTFPLSVPAPALAAGFTINTLRASSISNIDLAFSKQPGFDWYWYTPFGGVSTDSSPYTIINGNSVSNGGLGINEVSFGVNNGPTNTNSNAQIATIVYVGGGNTNWRGKAFGGGYYIQVLASIPGGAFNYGSGGANPLGGPGWPAMWAEPYEHITSPNDQWSGATAGIFWFIEQDWAEFDWNTGYEAGDTIAWIGNNGSGWYTGEFQNPINVAALGIDVTKPHYYGVRWTVATPTVNGTYQLYIDSVPVGNSISWPYYNPALAPPYVGANWPAGGVNTNPGAGGTFPVGLNPYQIMDQQHFVLILGTGSNSTHSGRMNVYSIEVWQTNDSGNLNIGG